MSRTYGTSCVLLDDAFDDPAELHFGQRSLAFEVDVGCLVFLFESQILCSE